MASPSGHFYPSFEEAWHLHQDTSIHPLKRPKSTRGPCTYIQSRHRASGPTSAFPCPGHKIASGPTLALLYPRYHTASGPTSALLYLIYIASGSARSPSNAFNLLFNLQVQSRGIPNTIWNWISFSPSPSRDLRINLWFLDHERGSLF